MLISTVNPVCTPVRVKVESPDVALDLQLQCRQVLGLERAPRQQLRQQLAIALILLPQQVVPVVDSAHLKLESAPRPLVKGMQNPS